VAGGAIVLGPALAPGSILNLDFVLLPHAPLPHGFWGLGPELPRRVPLLLPLTWLDPIVGSVVVGKVLVLAAMATAFVGAARLAGRAPLPWQVMAGVVYAFGPFATTRVAVGHLFVVAAMAVLPWALPRLLQPTHDLCRTYLWSFACALTGVVGGAFALASVASATAARRGARRSAASLLVALAAQAPWLVPGAVVSAQGVRIAGSEGFATDLGGFGGPLRLLGGGGFWQPSFQVGRDDVLVPLLGLALLALAVRGSCHLPADVRGRLPVVAGIALLVVLASGWSPLVGAYDALTSTAPGAAFREGQRILPLFLVWLAPAAALGAADLAARLRWSQVAAAAVAGTAAIVASGGAWGVDGQLRAVEVPDGWEEARDVVRAEPGTVLALPWFAYVDLDVVDGRRVQHPLPLWLGGDVLVSSDLRIPGVGGAERDDPRERTVSALVAANLRGERVAGELGGLGVRWVVVLLDGGLVRGQPVGRLHADALADDPGLRRVVATDAVEVYLVRSWRGTIVDDDGDAVPTDPLLDVVTRVDASGAATWARPGSRGWLRGLERVAVDERGLLRLPAGSGLVWYWPAAVCVSAYAASGAGALIAARQIGRARDAGLTRC
jgi:hypothetical protein